MNGDPHCNWPLPILRILSDGRCQWTDSDGGGGGDSGESASPPTDSEAHRGGTGKRVKLSAADSISGPVPVKLTAAPRPPSLLGLLP